MATDLPPSRLVRETARVCPRCEGAGRLPFDLDEFRLHRCGVCRGTGVDWERAIIPDPARALAAADEIIAAWEAMRWVHDSAEDVPRLPVEARLDLSERAHQRFDDALAAYRAAREGMGE